MWWLLVTSISLQWHKVLRTEHLLSPWTYVALHKQIKLHLEVNCGVAQAHVPMTHLTGHWKLRQKASLRAAVPFCGEGQLFYLGYGKEFLQKLVAVERNPAFSAIIQQICDHGYKQTQEE